MLLFSTEKDCARVVFCSGSQCSGAPLTVSVNMRFDIMSVCRVCRVRPSVSLGIHLSIGTSEVDWLSTLERRNCCEEELAANRLRSGTHSADALSHYHVTRSIITITTYLPNNLTIVPVPPRPSPERRALFQLN